MKKKCMLLVLTFLASPAYGMVYTWTDSAGIAYYTNKEYEIPLRYRAKAKHLYPEQADIGAPQQNAQNPQASTEVPPPSQQAASEVPNKGSLPPVVPARQAATKVPNKGSKTLQNIPKVSTAPTGRSTRSRTNSRSTYLPTD